MKIEHVDISKMSKNGLQQEVLRLRESNARWQERTLKAQRERDDLRKKVENHPLYAPFNDLCKRVRAEIREERRSDPSTYNVWMRVERALDRVLGEEELP